MHKSRKGNFSICPTVVLSQRDIPFIFDCFFLLFLSAKQSAVLAQLKRKEMKKKLGKTNALFVVFRTTTILRKSTDPVDKSLAIFLAEKETFLRSNLVKREKIFFLTLFHTFSLHFLLLPFFSFLFARFSVVNISAVH